jgi:hypothetical protein
MGQSIADTKPPLTCNTIPTLDYLAQLPLPVPALERPPSPFGNTSLIIPKRRGNSHPLPDGPADVTYYFPIKKCNPTGVFFPARYAYPPAIDVILYFHGFKLGEFSYINEYWSGHLHDIHFREDINLSGKSVVLIAPTLGPRPGGADDSDMGPFASGSGGDQFLAEIVRWIGKYVPQFASRCATPSIRNLVLAGHSGAGVILQKLAWGMETPIKQIWGFDSMYGSETKAERENKKITYHVADVVTDWLTLATSRQDITFFFHWGTSPLRDNETKLADLVKLSNLGNVTVAETKATRGQDSLAHHFAVLTSNFGPRVKNAACFQP